MRTARLIGLLVLLGAVALAAYGAYQVTADGFPPFISETDSGKPIIEVAYIGYPVFTLALLLLGSVLCFDGGRQEIRATGVEYLSDMGVLRAGVLYLRHGCVEIPTQAGPRLYFFIQQFDVMTGRYSPMKCVRYDEELPPCFKIQHNPFKITALKFPDPPIDVERPPERAEPVPA